MTTLRRWWRRPGEWANEVAADETGDVPGWVLVTLMTAGLPVIRKCEQLVALAMSRMGSSQAPPTFPDSIEGRFRG